MKELDPVGGGGAHAGSTPDPPMISHMYWNFKELLSDYFCKTVHASTIYLSLLLKGCYVHLIIDVYFSIHFR